ncbi:MAG: tetratricopeptide repeat protein [Saprospiraceae bacterium]|nr:tetratricopeptide repeat protein [Saprospiraceae bacterium]
MRTLSFLLTGSLVAILMFSCKPSESDMAARLGLPDIPKLLDRNPSIQQGKEWESVQSLYGKYRQELTQKPDALEPKLNLAQLFVNEARITGEHGHYYPGALKMVDEVLAKKPEDKDLLFRTLAVKAGVQLSQHEFSKALVTAKEAIALNPYNAQIYGALVDAHVELGQYDEAVAMADKMVSMRPDLRSYSRVSYLREIHGDPKGAIEAMEMAVSAGYPGQEQTCWARMTLGELYEHYGDTKMAEMQYRIILEERPEYPFAIAALGNLEIEKGNDAEGEKLLKQAAGIIPEVGFYEDLASLYKKRGDMAAFETTKKMVLEMLADDVAHGHNMNLEYANVYSNLLGDPDKALEYAKNEYERRPDNIDVNRVLAALYHKKNDTVKATEHLKKAARTNGAHPELLELKQELAMR